MKPKGLVLQPGSLPNINAHRAIDHLQFVHEGDIYAAKCISSNLVASAARHDETGIKVLMALE